MPDVPGSARVVARYHALALRLTVRSDGFAFARLGATGASTLRFCRTLSASAIVHGGD